MRSAYCVSRTCNAVDNRLASIDRHFRMRSSCCKDRPPMRHFSSLPRLPRAGDTERPMTDAALASRPATAHDTLPTRGILHFTIGVRDHLAAAKWYSEVLGCTHMRSTERYAFMECC